MNNAKYVEVVTMVEHPGGYDGGEFEHIETFGIDEKGALFYATDYPNCPTDVFTDSLSDDFVNVRTRAEAYEVLCVERDKAAARVAVLNELVREFENENAEFIVYFGGERYDECDDPTDECEE